MKKIIFILLIIFIGLLGYSYYSTNHVEPIVGPDTYTDGNPCVGENCFKNNIEDSAKKIIEKTKEESKKLVDKTKEITDDFMKETSDLVCCQTGAVVPNPIYQYEFTSVDSCKIPCEMVEHNGEVFESCAVGGSYRIVDSSYCNNVNELVCCERRSSHPEYIDDPWYEFLDEERCDIEYDIKKGIVGSGSYKVVDNIYCK